MKMVLDLYDEFKKFMGLNSILPALNPIIEKENSKSGETIPLAYVKVDEIKFPITNIHIREKLMNADDPLYIKMKLFHEFTHILDALILFKNYSKKEKITLLSTFSEYNASQNEMICGLGFENKHSITKISLENTLIPDQNDKITAELEYLRPMADATVIIDKDKDAYYNLSIVDYYQKYNIFEAKTMYYLGKKNVCMALSSKRLADITDQSYGIFSQQIRKIEKCLITRDFASLIMARQELWEMYTKYFINKDSVHLPMQI